MKSIIRLILFLALAAVTPSSATKLVLPLGLDVTEGGFKTSRPFIHPVISVFTGIQGLWQQAYPSAAFTTGAVTITEIAFRANGPEDFPGFTSEVSMTLCAQKNILGEGRLSQTFTENRNSTNIQEVFNGEKIFQADPSISTTGPKPFSYVFVLSTSFDYDPADGDLVLEVTNFGPNPQKIETGFLDASSTLDPDRYDRVYRSAGPGEVEESGFRDSLTIVTQFTTTPVDGGGGVQGDPHFMTWRGQHFDYFGECDLVLIHNADFESGGAVSLDVHIRTKIRRDMSYISSAALRIGNDVLEVESQGVYWFNGVLNSDLTEEFSGFAFSHTQPTDKQHVFEVHFGGRERIKLKTYKDFVSVLIEQGKSEHFHHSVGLMGDFTMGHMIARDGKTIIDDANAFGQEWQVLNTDPSLFQTARFPQHPDVCTMPTPVQADHLRRRLAETSLVDEAAAEKACEHWGEGKDDCVFDVLTTGDLEMAAVGAY
jgi:hypothetical protein